MSIQYPNKLNQLISEWPRGAIYTARFLKTKGYSHVLLDKYKKSSWIRPVGRGAYALYKDDFDWTGAVLALQTQLHLDVHPGGKSALEMKGYAHYLSPEKKRIELYGSIADSLPAWFLKYDWGSEITYTKTKLFPQAVRNGYTVDEVKGFSIKTSSPERAAMEMLYHVPKEVSFEEAFLIFENLVTLRPDVVQNLLENCNFIKVKRLFMYMAEQHQHPWVVHLDISGIDFGKGKRLIVNNGILDKKFLITVPKRNKEAER